MLFEHHSCRTYLKEYLSEGLVNGSVPSLRGLAQRLELSPSFLSEILKGKRSLSEEKAMKASAALGLSRDEQDYFQLMVRYDGTRDMTLKEGILAQMQLRSGSGKVNDLSVDTFKVMSDWYYAVILELLHVKEFSFSARTVADRLGLPLLTVEEALDRLERIHFVECTDGVYRRTSEEREVVDAVDQRNEALCKYHKQLLDRSKVALEVHAPASKYVGTEMVAFDPRDMEKARQIIESCFDQLSRLANQGKHRTEVYCAGIQFLNMSR